MLNNQDYIRTMLKIVINFSERIQLCLNKNPKLCCAVTEIDKIQFKICINFFLSKYFYFSPVF